MSLITDANVKTNAKTDADRHKRWSSVRDAAWGVISAHCAGNVAIVGAGNADSLPLRRIAANTTSLTLIDLDQRALERAATRLGNFPVTAPTLIVEDVTLGNADDLLESIRLSKPWPSSIHPSRAPLVPDTQFDLVVGDMFYTQIFHPALTQLKIGKDTRSTAMRHYDQQLTDLVVGRMHASSSATVIHINDVACWSKVHNQVLSVDDALADPDDCWRKLIRHDGCDPHLAAIRANSSIITTHWWRWEFYPGKDFLVRATVVDVSRKKKGAKA